MIIYSSVIHVGGELLQECVAENINRKRRVVICDEDVL
jgi:hypothetical protein